MESLRKKAALELVLEADREGIWLFCRCRSLGELFNLLVHKAKRSPAKARKAILSWRDAFPVD